MTEATRKVFTEVIDEVSSMLIFTLTSKQEMPPVGHKIECTLQPTFLYSLWTVLRELSFVTLLTVLTTSLTSSLEYSVHEQEFVNASVYLSAANCRYAKNNYVKKMQTFIYLFSTTSQIPGCFQARAYPICHGAKEGVHPGQVPSPSQR